jgi:hypothetical protein
MLTTTYDSTGFRGCSCVLLFTYLLLNVAPNGRKSVSNWMWYHVNWTWSFGLVTIWTWSFGIVTVWTSVMLFPYAATVFNAFTMLHAEIHQK